MRIRAVLPLALATLAACGREAASAPPSASAPARSAPKPVAVLAAAQLPRCADPRYLDAVRAFERGEFARAKELWLALPESLDAALLGARIHAVEGDEIGAVRAIEALRAAQPGQGRVYATAAEIHAAAGRLSSAEDEIRDGLVAAGPTPDLARARGVLALCRAGGARVGLEHLLAAVGELPGLEFAARPISQAHILLGNQALAAQNALDAAGHAKAALAALPDDHDAEQLLADALAGLGDFDGALALYEKLVAQGVDLRGALSLLAVRGATAALVEQKRDLALARYLRARELGMTDEELGFGVTVLAEEASKALEAGLAAYEQADLARARERFERALRCEPNSIAGHNHLAVVLFKQSEFAAAAAHWRAVLELAQRDGVELPEPVHLNLARALHQAGRPDEVRPVLADYLAHSPQGEHAAATRAMLERLDAEDRARAVEGAAPPGR